MRVCQIDAMAAQFTQHSEESRIIGFKSFAKFVMPYLQRVFGKVRFRIEISAPEIQQKRPGDDGHFDSQPLVIESARSWHV